MRLLYLANYFLAGAVAVTLGGWLLNHSPNFLATAIRFGAVSFLLLVLALVFDEPICDACGLEESQYYLGLAIMAGSLACGCLMVWGLL